MSEPGADPFEGIEFYSRGENNVIETPGHMQGAPEIALGSRIVLRAGYWLNVCTPVTGYRPKIVIGDGVQANTGLRLSAANSIVLEENVICGPNVFIADTDHEYRHVGLPVLNQGITRTDGSVTVGAGSWLGTNSVVVGQVAIGKGCVIGANSVVTKDVPDYSVAVGTPARVVKMYDPDARDWVRTRTAADVEEVLRRRRERPLLTVAIPTYNRAADLAKCLESLLPQTGRNGLVEVCVSDNASTDETPRVLARFAGQYPQLRARRNAENVGAERNLLELVPFARGRYVKLHGDDDFFRPDTVQSLVYALRTMEGSSVVFLDVLRSDNAMELTEGMETFLREASIQAGFITSLILDREALARLEEPERFVGSGFNHVHWAYRLLEGNPNFGIVRAGLFEYAGNPPAGYNFGDYFVRGYLEVLASFVGRGLSPGAYAAEKRRLLETTVLPWLERIVREGMPADVGGFEKIFAAHYSEEPYYPEALERVRKALSPPDSPART